MEYSSRNRHCLVDMEYSLDSACLEDSLVQPADPSQAPMASEPPGSAEALGDERDKPQPTGALAALVKVRTRFKDSFSHFEELFGLGCCRQSEPLMSCHKEKSFYFPETALILYCC